MVAVITNGTAILGLGNLGPLASKPVMEGKAVLFKRFADVDSIDLELATEDADAFINAVALMEPSFGGINLEDIKAPECFIIEQALRERMNIPVFHDDQHGTAIIAAAGLINALYLTGRDRKDIKLVVNGAGAAAIACTELVKALGVPGDQVLLCDSKGVVYKGRTEGMNQWKSAHAAATKARTLAEAISGADVVFGLSVAGAFTPDMIKSMAPKPIIFAMANPNPEIRPEDVKAIRDDAIVATGRSDYPNQINNVLGFPYIFRGALDVRATTINEEMKIAAATTLAELARQQVPEEVSAAYGGGGRSFGPEYIIPAPFDPRLIEMVPMAVARAAMATGVARKPIVDWAAYQQELRARLNPTTAVLATAHEELRANPKRVIFAEAEEETVIRAAIAFREGGYGTPVLVGRDETVRKRLRIMGANPADFEIHNAKISPHVRAMVDRLYERLQRKGYLRRDCLRLVNQDRHVFRALMLDMGQGDALVTGMTYALPWQSMLQVKLGIDPAPGRVPSGIHMLVGRHRTVLIADTTVNESPDAACLAAHRRADRRRGAPHGTGATRGVPVLLQLRQSARALVGSYPRRRKASRCPKSGLRIRRRNGRGRGPQPGHETPLSVQSPLRARQCAGHARPAIGQYLGQEAPQGSQRQHGDRAVPRWHGQAGTDRGHDLDRHRPHHHGRSGRRGIPAVTSFGQIESRKWITSAVRQSFVGVKNSTVVLGLVPRTHGTAERPMQMGPGNKSQGDGKVDGAAKRS